VCATLLSRAETAAKDGYQSRAIRLLARVMELAPEHKAARSMLDRLRKREQRTRQLLLGGGLVAVVGLVGAAVMLLDLSGESADPPPIVRRADPGPDAKAVDPGPSREGPVPAVGATTDDPGSEAKAKTTADSAAEAGAASAAEESAGQGPDSGAGSAAPTPGPDRPTRPGGRKARAVQCTVVLEGVPEASATFLQLRVSGQSPVTPKGLKHSFEITEDSVKLNVEGKWRTDRPRTVTRQDCEAGPITIEVAPKPARVDFPDAPADAAITCLKCPRGIGKGPYTAGSFPTLPIASNESSVTVRFKFQCEGYRDREVQEVLYPGPNDVRMHLQPL
jgi:hypothetical protein